MDFLFSALTNKPLKTTGTVFPISSPSGFNIVIGNIGGGGFFATLYDGATAIFQRRNNSGGNDVTLGGTNKIDRYTSYTYDPKKKLLTLIGAIDTVNGITYTRIETYKFISPTVIENTWTITANGAGTIAMTNWNYYLQAINAVWDVGNSNFGNGTSTNPLGLGVQLSVGGSIYGVISANDYECMNSRSKIATAAQAGIAVTVPNFNLTSSNSLTLKQWFFKSTNTQTDFMLQAQLAVSAAKNFSGSNFDKICQATAYLNTSLMNNLTNVKLVPSLHYGGSGMWMRDSFWQSLLVSNTIEQNVLSLFESLQQGNGQIATNINSSSAVGQLRQDESTSLDLIRADYDKVVRGLNISSTAPANALTYLLSHVVNNQYQNDATDSNVFKSLWDQFITTVNSYSAYTQGMYCLALKCGQLLGLNITNAQITNAIAQYQALYNAALTFIKMESDLSFFDISCLTPEALCIFILGQKMLSDTSVANTISFIQAKATVYGASNMTDKNGGYVGPGDFADTPTNGDYQNGASWFLYEYLAYYAGKNHGVSGMDTAIANRKAIELNVDNVLHEYLQTTNVNLNFPGSEDPSRHVYSWNAASFIIK